MLAIHARPSGCLLLCLRIQSRVRFDTLATTFRIFIARAENELIKSAVDTRPSRQIPAIIHS